MVMKQHILNGMQAELDLWNKVLSAMPAGQLETALIPSHWSVKDVLAHMTAWLTRSNARLAAAVNGGEPVFPEWAPEADPQLVEDGDAVNAWLYEQYRELPYAEVYKRWSNAYHQLMTHMDQLDDYKLFEWEMFDWMGETPIIEVVLGSYMHHVEHYDHLVGWLKEHRAEV